MQYANHPARVLRLSPANPGGVAGYSWCGTDTTDLSEGTGYYQGSASPWVIGATDVERDQHYDAGDHPLMATTGTLRFKMAFSATMAIGSEPPAPQMPACDGPNPPTADFKVVNPAPIEEGETVQFVDRSTDPDADISQWKWDFAGTGSSTATDATYGDGFPDEGTYPVRLTVTDAQGHSGTVVKDVTVVNAAPSVDIARPVILSPAKVKTSVYATIGDPGEHDRDSLQVAICRRTRPSVGRARCAVPQAIFTSTSPTCPRGSTR